MCVELSDWEKCTEFHGHSCPGLSIGYMAALIALKELKIEKAKDEELFVIVETDACGVDAVQVLTGCTLGKGNLIYRDLGKQVFTFGHRKTGEAVRIAVENNVMNRSPEHRMLQQKVMKGLATDAERKRFWEAHQSLSEQILKLSTEEFCKIRRVDIEFPKKARIFESIICSICQEQVMEPRARVKDGKVVCLDCAGEVYSRGW